MVGLKLGFQETNPMPAEVYNRIMVGLKHRFVATLHVGDKFIIESWWD